MKRSRKLAAGAALAAAAVTPWPVLEGGGVAHAGEGDEKHAALTWDFQLPAAQPTICTFAASASLREFDGGAYIFLDDDEPACVPTGFDVVLRYTDRFGNPGAVRTTVRDPGPDTRAVASAEDVEGDLVVQVTAWYTPGEYVTQRRLTPK